MATEASVEAKPLATVAVVGAGPTGLSMAKTLREDGFAVTLFERRSKVGGLWAYTEDPTMTTAMPGTRANISKYTCGFSDYPMPDDYPPFLSQTQFQEYMESYTTAFDLHRDIVFNTSVVKVVRNADGTKWSVETESKTDGTHEVREFDKVGLCHGYQNKPVMPDYDGVELFEGQLIHSMQFRRPEELKGKNVVFVGIGATASDLIPTVVPHAAKVYVSHRRGAYITSRWRNGLPIDLGINRSRREISFMLQRHAPVLARQIADFALARLTQSKYKDRLDPSWGLDKDVASITLSISVMDEEILDLLVDGKLTNKPGIKRFLGGRSIEFTDGSVVDDIDMVVSCTGYEADFSLTPFIETSTPETDLKGNPYGGPPIARLWMNLFPPAHADSIALLTFSQFGKNNGFSFSDVTSMAISNIWRGVSADVVPASRTEMERAVDMHQRWVAGQWQLDHTIDVSMVRQWEFQGFLHRAAGTGMDNLGWGWKGWWFWLQDPKMSYLMNHGLETAHAFRFFETGRRKTWPGAREAIIHMNKLVKQIPMRK